MCVLEVEVDENAVIRGGYSYWDLRFVLKFGAYIKYNVQDLVLYPQLPY